MAVVWNPKTKLCILHYTNLFTVGCLCHVMISRLASWFATHSWLLSPGPYWSAGRHLLSSRRPHHWKLFIYCVIDEKMTRLLPFACSSNFSHRFSFFCRWFANAALGLDNRRCVSGPSQDRLHCVFSVARWVLMTFARLGTERRV